MSDDLPEEVLTIHAAMFVFADDADQAVGPLSGTPIPPDWQAPPLAVATPLALALIAEVAHQRSLLEGLRAKLEAGTLLACGFFDGDRTRSDVARDWWEGARLDPTNSSAVARGVAIHNIIVCRVALEQERLHRQSGPPSVGPRMLEVLDQLLTDDQRFPTKVAAYKAVMSGLGFTTAPRGFSYKSFVRHVGDRLTGLPDK